MVGEFVLAFVAGLVTILNPCVLPLVPVLVGSALGKHRAGPVALAAGLGVSFTLFGFTIIAFGFQLGVNEQGMRMFAGSLLLTAGLLLLVPKAQAALTALVAPVTSLASGGLGRISSEGLNGQFLVGLLLGVVWAPCIGLTLGAAIAAASQGDGLFQAFVTFLVFALGVGVSIVLFAFGSRKALGSGAQRLQSLARYAKPAFGIILILIGLMVVTGTDKVAETWVLQAMPQWLVVFTTQL